MPHAQRWHAHLLGFGGRPSPPRFHEPDLPEHYPPDLELEPTHLDIDLYISIVSRSVGGRVTTTVVARRDSAPTLKLDAVDFEDVSVRDTAGRNLTWQYDGKKLDIRWEDPFSALEERHVEVAYRVIAPTSGLYFAGPDAAYPDQPAFVASDHETERARHWLPCIDLPNVQTTLDLRLRAEARHTILANGYLVHEHENGDGTKTAHWRLEQPCPSYLICIAVGDLIRADDGVFDDGEKSIPLAYFCSPEHTAEDLLRSFGRTRDMLAWMTQLLDQPFPYPKYYQVALSVLGGAMENISLVAWSDFAVLDTAVAPEYNWRIDQINVHEMAHSYFGDAVVCRDFAHAWLKESWATYIEQCWQAAVGGPDAEDYVYHLHAQAYFEECEDYRRPIVTRRFRSSWDLYDTHLYEGGACRLHMLRGLLGDATFWSAVRAYLVRYKHRVVETDDFRRILEEFSGRALGKFFDQWFHSPGYPDIKVEFDYSEERQEGLFTIEQKQVDPEKGIPAFEFTTEVGWTQGNEEYRRTVIVNAARTVIAVPMSAKPDIVRFDPGNLVLHRLEFNPGDPMLRRQLTAAPDIRGRIHAGYTLAKTAKRANLLALVDAYLQEPFWGVRCEFAKALGEADHTTAIEGLAQLIAVEQEPRVLIALLQAAAAYRSPLLIEAIQTRLARGLRPIATQFALMALGKQRDAAPFALLEEIGRDGSVHWRVQAGALRGLGETRQEAALAVLREQTRYGASRQVVREFAIRALGQIGRNFTHGTRATIVEQLADHLRDPWFEARWSAAAALSTLDDPEGIALIEGFARNLSTQEQATLSRMIDGLRARDKAEGSALKKQVEDLREKVRRLEEQMQTLATRQEAESPAA